MKCYEFDLWLGRRLRRSIVRYGDIVVLATLLLVILVVGYVGV